MKNTFRLIVLFAAISAPLWAASKGGVTIPQDTSVGSTRVAAGEYKVSVDGSGPNVKVTLAKSGSAPIVLEAKLNPGPKGTPFVTLSTKNGASVLKEIDLNGVILVFEAAESAAQ